MTPPTPSTVNAEPVRPVSTTTKKKTITVLGSLGGQGGSVVKSFLETGNFHVRGVTSGTTSSEAALALQALGVEMYQGKVTDPPTLKDAFHGADIAFVVVNFWDPQIGTNEGTLTKQIFDIARAAGVRQIIYSSLANVSKTSNGTINVPHFTLKAEAYEYLQTLEFEFVTAVEPAAYYSNWFTFFKSVKDPDDPDTLVWTWPSKSNSPLSQFDVKTGTGPAVLHVALNPNKCNNTSILLEADKLTPTQIVDQIAARLGKKGRINFMDPNEFTQAFPQGGQELAQMVKWFDTYGYYGPESPDRVHSSGRKLVGENNLITFQQWLDTEEYKSMVEH